jgi:AraC family transcriptional regulator of adaptative response / DNA-3-methyladenine glycosylase II
VLRGPRRRTDALLAIADALATGKVEVHVGRDADELREELLTLPGVGPWTADCVLMRVLGAPDVLPTGDLSLRRNAAGLGLGTDSLAERAQAWRPWRSYAAMYLWRAKG